MWDFLRRLWRETPPDAPEPLLDEKQQFDALIERALAAQSEAPPEQQPVASHILLPSFLADEVKRLPDAERAALLGTIVAFEPQLAPLLPYQRDYVLNTGKALRSHPPAMTPEVAADFLRICRYGVYGHPVELPKIIKLMEREPAGTFMGHEPLRDAYLTLKRQYGLAASRVASNEIAQRIERLLGLKQEDPVPAAPNVPPWARAPDMDGPHVDAYAEAQETYLGELDDWKSTVEASNPTALDDAIQDWVTRYGERVDQSQRYLANRFAPVECYARLDPPAPQWLIESYRPSLRTDVDFPIVTDERDGACIFTGRVLGRKDWGGLLIFDRQLVARARQAKRVIEAGWPQHDWSRSDVAARNLLAVEGDDPTALFKLLWQARSPTPSKQWLDAAGRLLASSSSVLKAVVNWLEEFPLPPSSIPADADYDLVRHFRNFCADVERKLAQYGDARTAAAAAIGPQYIHEVKTVPTPVAYQQTHSRHPSAVSEENALILCGCIRFLSLVRDRDTIARLQRIALACLTEIPGSQYRSLKGVNACIWSLGRIATPEAVTALGRLKLKVRDERLNKQIAKAMAEAAAQADIAIEDLEELATPGFDLEAGGVRRVVLAGGVCATLAIKSTTEVDITLRRADGTVVKSVPAPVKADPPSVAALKALKASSAELAQVLPVARLRLERSWLTGRSWTWDQFRERLLEHPLLAWFASRLVWTVTTGEGIAHSCTFRVDGQAIGADGQPLPTPRGNDTIRLWHPIMPVEPKAVERWRVFLQRHEIVQPIKQVHREIYALTPAEVESATYSNRFAGHIVRQAQANALGRLRGWSCRSRIWADVPNDAPTHIKIPAYGLAAEYWTEGAGGEEPEVTDSQAYLFLTTDRVCFRRLIDDGDWRRDGGRSLTLGAEQIRLDDVTPVVFSEVMRDVDLFVGVASIGHDPTWLDGGVDAQHPNQWRHDVAAAYWREFNTAELNESSKVRRSFIATLLPSLAIAAKLTLDDRHLVVQGKLRTYKIHLGSGNIIMEPDGRYLCIVPKEAAKQPASGHVLLPFEGDKLLSVILSKAFMLANDTAITDQSILAQIRH